MKTVQKRNCVNWVLCKSRDRSSSHFPNFYQCTKIEILKYIFRFEQSLITRLSFTFRFHSIHHFLRIPYPLQIRRSSKKYTYIFFHLLSVRIQDICKRNPSSVYQRRNHTLVSFFVRKKFQKNRMNFKYIFLLYYFTRQVLMLCWNDNYYKWANILKLWIFCTYEIWFYTLNPLNTFAKIVIAMTQYLKKQWVLKYNKNLDEYFVEDFQLKPLSIISQQKLFLRV